MIFVIISAYGKSSPVSTLIFSLLGWGVIPLGQGLTLFDYSLGIFYTLALSSIII